ncbi:MAG TPA: hypothetical protein VNZ22_20885, partial [Bacillota bacterium]|nr:hypothetical protein [Bacillota bacterium]
MKHYLSGLMALLVAVISVVPRHVLADSVAPPPKTSVPAAPIQSAAPGKPGEIDSKAALRGDLSRSDDGYRGIWFTLGQPSEYGDKYSGGLGTYTANHIPLAIYA